MAPGTNLMDKHSKTFSSRHKLSNSHLLVGECLFLQLLPHLLPQPFGFVFSIIEGLELRPALRFPYYNALSLFVLQKPPRNN